MPYDVNYVWRFGAEDVSHDRLDPSELTERRAAFIRQTLPRQAKAAPGDVILEKSVSNTLRVPFVDAVFPNAAYVHLVRDGRDVVESAMRQWQAKPDLRALWTKLRGMPLSNAGYAMWFGGNLLKGLVSGRGGGKVWGPRFDGIERIAEEDGLAAVCAYQWVCSVQQATADLAELGDRVHEIRYERLVDAPDTVVGLAQALDLPDPDAVRDTAHARLRPQRSGWANLPRAQQDTIMAIIGPTLAELGYT